MSRADKLELHESWEWSGLLLRAFNELRIAGERGLTRHELAVKLSTPKHKIHERTARQLVAQIREEGILPVITTAPDGKRGPRRYRIAQNREEFLRYRSELISRIRHLARAVRGLESSRRWYDPELTPLLERIIELEEKE